VIFPGWRRYPYGGPLDAEAGRVGGTSSVVSRDAYGGGPVSRYVTSISAEADPGNSGGPAVNREGEVVGTVFASARYGDVAYAIPPSVVAEQIDAAESRIASASVLRLPMLPPPESHVWDGKDATSGLSGQPGRI
jgi:S1-C subfamily serine protease